MTGNLTPAQDRTSGRRPENADRHSVGASLPDRSAHFARSMRLLTDRLGGRIAFGGDYNPEQWPADVWPEDIALMQQAGVNLVSLGIFSWALLEPSPGQYEFGWLDQVMDLLNAGGIAVDLANASASPPPWFSRRHPESMLTDQHGVRRSYGGRQGFCPSSVEYRRAAAALTDEIAARYVDHPATAMWHVHNEYGNHNWSCYCDVSAEAFRRWLQMRYGTLAELNYAWGTTFWSQKYCDWQEILPPRTPSYLTFSNPTQQLDFSRFSSDELLDCFRAEADIIRSRSKLPVTTNFMQFWKPMDYWRWSQEMDLISNDHYRSAALGVAGATHDLAMSADLLRSLADGSPWLLMEHSTSAVNWQPRNPAKGPGQMRRDSLTHVAHGADGALFFQWRASKAGAEKFHSGMLPHAGTDTQRWREVCDLGTDLARLSDVTGSQAVADVAIVFDWHAWWGVELDSHPSVEVNQMDAVRRWHRTLWENGYTCDFVHPDRDMTKYRVVLVPSLYLCTDDTARRIAAVADRGGAVVVGYFSGIADVDDHIRLGGYPGAFTELLGVRTEEFSPLLEDESVALTVSPELGVTAGRTGSKWTELIGHVEPDVDVVVSFAGGIFPGHPAVTRRRLGTGRSVELPIPAENSNRVGTAWYVATELDGDLLATVLRNACDAAGVEQALPLREWPAGLDAVVRGTEDTRYLFVVNSGSEAAPIGWDGTDLLTGRQWPSGSLLPAGQVAVIAAPVKAT